MFRIGKWSRASVATVALGVVAVACGSAKQSPTSPGSTTTTAPTPTPTVLPAGVTQAMIAEGQTIYAGGTCSMCHGANGKNGPFAPDLTDNVFLQNSGGYEEIVSVITTGVPAEKFKSPSSQKDLFMLPKGAMTLSDTQLRSLAAYVWALSHPNG